MSSQILAGRYEVQRQLARKDNRLTLLARDLQTNELVVLKVMTFHEHLEADRLALFEREVTVLQNLFHPAIPRYIDHFQQKSLRGLRFTLVQTYIPARSLEEYFQAGRIFNEAEAKYIARSMLEILDYLHRLFPPVIHRDIKPGNILLAREEHDPFPQIYLVDFGAVELLTERHDTTSITVGTYGYMPPEQFSGRVMACSDLYSLGVTLITLMTRTAPGHLPRRNLRIQFEELVQVSPAFADWLKWMTEPCFDQRLSSAQDALDALLKERQRQLPTSSRVRRKPPGSRIWVQKTAALLEVIIPPMGMNCAAYYLCLFALVWNLSLLGYTLLFLRSPINWIALALSLPFWGIGLFVIGMILIAVYSQVRLRLDQKQISLSYQLLKHKFHFPPPAPINTVSKLKLIKNSNENQTRTQPRVIIWAKTRKYEIGSHPLFKLVTFLKLTNDPSGFSTLTDAELEWLAEELGDRLGIPIIRE